MSTFLSHFVAPILWRFFLRSQRYRYYASMRCRQYDSLEKNKELQREKLFHIVNYAVQHIPYYKMIAKERGIVVDRKSIFSDIKKFPVLTKEIIRREGKNLCNPKIVAKVNTSGGTTGEPVSFYQDQSTRDFGAATKMLFYEWAGRHDGEFMMSLWGSERDILQGGEGTRGWLVRYFTNVELLNAFKMTPQRMTAYWAMLKNKRPKLLLAYVQSAYELARYAEKKGLGSLNIGALMTSAGNLSRPVRMFLESVYQCKVFNRYGSREVGDMACSCEKGEELHLNIFNHFMEVLDTTDGEVDVQNSGSIHITTLNNYAMPLLRYRIGDRSTGIDWTSPCFCGRGLPRIAKLLGRDVEVFLLSDGSIVDGEYFTHLFYHKTWVEKFQVIQEALDTVIVRVVKIDSEKIVEDQVEIEMAIRTVMGERCVIVWEFVPEIDPLPSGKFLYTISKVKMI